LGISSFPYSPLTEKQVLSRSGEIWMTVSPHREQIIGIACALAVVVLWSSFLVLSRYGATGILTPFDLAALRFGVSGIIMLPLLLRNGFRGLRFSQVVAITLSAGPAFALFAYGGFSLAPTAHGGVLITGMAPLFTTLLAVLMIKERLGPTRIISLLVILCGMGLMARESLTFTASDQIWGDILFLGASISWSAYTVFARAWRLTAIQATAIVATLSMIAYLPVYLLFLPSNLFIAPLGEVFLQGIFQGFLSVIVALLAFTRAVAALGPVVTIMMTSVVPGTAALAAIPLLHEPLSAMAGVGIIFVTSGMVGGVLSIRR
jgi:drug/metabolite transporter (DMT)-like permease